MRRFEAVWGALLDDPVCGRPEGHSPPCRTVQAVAAALRRDLSPARARQNNDLRNARRRRARQAGESRAA
jgi:hypothetical protein